MCENSTACDRDPLCPILADLVAATGDDLTGYFRDCPTCCRRFDKDNPKPPRLCESADTC